MYLLFSFCVTIVMGVFELKKRQTKKTVQYKIEQVFIKAAIRHEITLNFAPLNFILTFLSFIHGCIIQTTYSYIDYNFLKL